MILRVLPLFRGAWLLLTVGVVVFKTTSHVVQANEVVFQLGYGDMVVEDGVVRRAREVSRSSPVDKSGRRKVRGAAAGHRRGLSKAKGSGDHDSDDSLENWPDAYLPEPRTPSNMHPSSDLLQHFWYWNLCQRHSEDPGDQPACFQDNTLFGPDKHYLLYLIDFLDNATAPLVTRECMAVPSDHWVVISLGSSTSLTDFVNTTWMNEQDTPDSIRSIVRSDFNAINKYELLVDGVPFDHVDVAETPSLHSLPKVVNNKCSHPRAQRWDGWSYYSKGLIARIPPFQTAGTRLITVTMDVTVPATGETYYFGTEFILNVVDVPEW